MLKDKINSMIENNKQEIIDYLSVFIKELNKIYDDDTKSLCSKLGFEIKYYDNDFLNVDSFLRIFNNKLIISINDRLDSYQTDIQLIKELLMYFIIRYYKDNNRLSIEEAEDKHLYYVHKYDNKSSADYISSYFSCVLLNDKYNDRINIEKNNKNLKKTKKKVNKMVNK